MNIDMNKQDYIYYKNKKGIVIYHVLSKRRIILDEKYTERVIDYLDKNKEDMEFYEFLVNTFDEEKKNKDNIVNIELMTANTCNLSCKYCYANGGTYGKNRSIMQENTVIDILNYVSKISNNIKIVNFFGGEPFLGYKAIIKTCEWFEKNYDELPIFKVVTNFTYLPDELLDAIIKYKIIITVSLDGPKEINDKQRVFSYQHLSVYDAVTQNLCRLEKRNYKIQAIECTYTEQHKIMGYSKNDLEKYLKTNFNVNQIMICDEMIRDNSKCIDCGQLEKSVNSNIEELKTNEILINRCLNKEYSGDGLCAAGRFSISIDPEGNIYPCHLFRLNDSFKMGNIYDKEKNIFNSLSYKKLKNQRKVLGCDECSARNICSQCFEKMIYTNDVLKFNCDKIRQFNRYYIASIDNININELSKLKTRN